MMLLLWTVQNITPPLSTFCRRICRYVASLQNVCTAKNVFLNQIKDLAKGISVMSSYQLVC